jgi:hypothetical protein
MMKMDSSLDSGVKRLSKNSVYGVVLSFEIAQKARVVAAMQGMSRSKLMRGLLEDYLKTQTARQLAQSQAGLNPAPVLPMPAQEIKHERENVPS